MNKHTNHLGQPIGFPLDKWSPSTRPTHSQMEGQLCRIEPLKAEHHAKALFAAFSTDTDDRNWTYLPYGPFADFESFRVWLKDISKDEDPYFYAVIDLESGQAVGVASYLRIQPQYGVIEVGHIHFSPLIQRTRLSTEAMFLMMNQVFEALGYRRYEWKCDALNAPSRKAASRLGFSFEGVFRQMLMYKGRNRDTAWYSIIDTEWPTVRLAYKSWLDPDNFDADGKQRKSLSDLMRK